MTGKKRIIPELDDEVNMGRLENVRRLLQQGTDVNERNALGDTPLIAAAHTGQADMVRLLLEFGADGTMTDLICRGRAGSSGLDDARGRTVPVPDAGAVSSPRAEPLGFNRATPRLRGQKSKFRKQFLARAGGGLHF